MRSTFDEPGTKLAFETSSNPTEPAEIAEKLEAYFRAWRMPESWVPELLAETSMAVSCELLKNPQADPHRVAIDEADRQIRSRMDEALALNPAFETGRVQPDHALAFILSHLPENSPARLSGDPDPARLIERAKRTEREPRTHLSTMHTALTRLPSIRMIAGWFVMVLLLFLTFVFTR